MWGWYREGQVPGQAGQPFLFVGDKGGGCLASWQSYDHVVPQPEHNVVPAVLFEGQWQISQIRMLFREQAMDQFPVDIYFGRWRTGRMGILAALGMCHDGTKLRHFHPTETFRSIG